MLVANDSGDCDDMIMMVMIKILLVMMSIENGDSNSYYLGWSALCLKYFKVAKAWRVPRTCCMGASQWIRPYFHLIGIFVHKHSLHRVRNIKVSVYNITFCLRRCIKQDPNFIIIK